MDAFLYQAALYCPDCTRKIKRELRAEGKDPRDYEDEHEYDSGEYPKGPFPEGGGEADIPQHCDLCHVFLENPLTSEGEAYVREAVREDHERRKRGEKANPVVGEWEAFYDYIDYGIEDEDQREEMEDMLSAHGLDPREAEDLQGRGMDAHELASVLEDPRAMERWDLRLARPLQLRRGSPVIVRAYRAGPGRGLAYGKFDGSLDEDLSGKRPWSVVRVERASDAEPIAVYVFSVDEA